MTGAENVAALLELAERAEAAEGADRELDEEIAQHHGWRLSVYGSKKQWKWPDRRGSFQSPPAYTASLDAALTLVPEEHKWRLMPSDFEGYTLASVWPNDDSDDRFEQFGRAATPALALCAAALRARAAS